MFKTVQKITQWSFSRYTQYQECPYKAKLRFIEKRDTPGGPAMVRGAEIHGLAQDYLEGRKRTVPVDLSYVKPLLMKYKKMKATSEGEIGITREWGQTGWFDHDVWCRIKLDAIVPLGKKGEEADAVDWKTGKYAPDRPEYAEQLELYATGILSVRPSVKVVHTKLIFTDHDQKTSPPVIATYERGQLKGMQKSWEKRVKPMLADSRFAPRPGNYCRYCTFRKAVGGPCKY